jgi:hypothetical protein
MSGAANRRVRKPDGSTVDLGADQRTFTQTDLLGIYTIESPNNTRQFAINLSARESQTDPMPIEDIEKLGVAMDPSSNIAVERTEQSMVQSSFSEMESEQKLWRWVIAAALALLLAETWLGGRLTRTDPAPEGEQT